MMGQRETYRSHLALPPRLILSVDEVAAVKSLRKSMKPDPVHFALDAEMAGIQGIKAHLRMDRKYIQEADVEQLNKMVKSEFFLQISINQDVTHWVHSFRPKNVILAAERRDEVGTETGLDVTLLAKQLLSTIREIDNHETRIFLAVDPDLEQIKASAKLEVHGVCISLREPILHGTLMPPSNRAYKAIQDAVRLSVKYGLETHLFNHISSEHLPIVGGIPGVSAIHLGHAFVGDCLFKGIAETVKHYSHSLGTVRDRS